MFANLIRRLTSDSAEPMPDTDARLALGALMVRIARSDGTYAAAEIAHIDRMLGRRYGLTPVEAAKLRAQCEALEKAAPDTVRFTKAVKAAVRYEEREDVVRALWAVALVDGERDAEESGLLRLIAPMLGVSDLDSNRIRRSVEESG